MSEELPIPEPVPEISRRRLWSSLAIPPVMTLLANGMIAIIAKGGGSASASLGIPVVMFFVIIGLTQHFHDTISKRYRGRSLIFLNFSFFLGQIIVCLTLWFGSCALFYPPLNLH